MPFLKEYKIKAAGGWDSFKIKPKANFSQFPKLGAEGANFQPKMGPKMSPEMDPQMARSESLKSS